MLILPANKLALLLLACGACLLFRHRQSTASAKMYTNKITGDEYRLADLMFYSRPATGMHRMYPHVIPYGDMLHPAKRSYQFGFPEFLRNGMASGVPTQFVMYVKPTAGSGSSSSNVAPSNNFDDWLNRRKEGAAEAEPVVITFSDLLALNFSLEASLLSKLGDNRLNSNGNKMTEYLYRHHIREFLVGTWTSWAEDLIFHPEENVWTRRPLACYIVSDVSCFWKRFLLILLSTNIETYKSSVLREPTIDDELYNLADTMAVSFWYAYCRLLSDTGELKGNAANYCPNPCRNNPCADMAYTVIDSCEVQDGGMYELDFKCTCTENAIWSHTKRACVIYDRCKMNSPCSLSGTESCDFNPMLNEVRCHCKADFMGHDCSQERNACFVRQVTKHGSKATGNRACNVESGNKCNPQLGTNFYSCECNSGWLIDKSWGTCQQSECGMEPNCQRHRDPCMALPCENGDCVSGSEVALCQCPVTHFGRHCSQRRGLWSAWGPWSSCDPDCGDRRVRHRSRGCLGVQCLGHGHESEWCPGLVDCGVPEKLGNYPTNRWRTATVLRQLLVAIAIGASVGMGVLFTCQCCLMVVLKCDRGLLNSAVAERVHTGQLLTYRRLSYKTAMQPR